MKRIVVQCLIISACVLLLSGCGSETSDLERWVQTERARPGKAIDPIPPIQSPEPVAYEGMDYRDPFQSVTRRDEDEEAAEIAAADAASEGPRPIPDRRKEYLESFPLDTLAMVGTMSIGDVLYALIQDNEKVVHRVREGNYLGQNHGLVQAVRAGQVEVRELVRDGRGNWLERQVRVAMPVD